MADHERVLCLQGHADRGMFSELHTFVGAMMQGVVTNRTVIQVCMLMEEPCK